MKKGNVKNVLFVFGGVSCERDISVITGVLALNCTDKNIYNPVPLYITENGCFTGDKLFDLSFYKARSLDGAEKAALLAGDGNLYSVKRGKLKKLCEIFCAVNCCHGLNGEDGCVAGLVRLSGIPFASPDMLASSVYMDKAAAKYYLSGLGVDILPYKTVEKPAFYRNRELVLSSVERNMEYPVIVKPARLGSSIGIKRADNRDRLIEAIEYALKFDGRIIIEKALCDFIEINCAAYRHKGRIIVSECENPKAGGDMLSFEDKYGSGLKHALSRDFPADIPKETSDKIKAITELVYRETYACGVIRIDYLLTRGGEIYLNEVNTVPGSLALYLFRNSVSEFGQVLSELIEEGVRERRDFDNGTFVYPSNVLSGAGSKTMGLKRSTNRR
ncbi:MAG: hypothetical protein J6Z34_01225 [Clostridia bacterium]|nr:hypothetical protein [Clostridia bacterium]